MPLYRIFEGKDKKKCYVKNVRGKALSAIEITARNAVRPTSHFSEEEIKAFGLEDHEREVVTGISLEEKAQEKFKDAEEPHYVVFVPFTNRHQVYERDKDGNLSAIGIDAKESYEDSSVFTRREMLEMGLEKCSKEYFFKHKEAYEREGNKVEPSRRIYSREYDKKHPESVYYSRIKAGAKQFAVASSEKFRKSIQAHGTERYVEDLKIIRQLIDDAIEKYQKKQ